MEVLGMTIAIEKGIYRVERENDGEVRVTYTDGASGLFRGTASRDACFDIALQIAKDAYGERPRTGLPRCTNSMLSDITDAVQRVAGC